MNLHPNPYLCEYCGAERDEPCSQSKTLNCETRKKQIMGTNINPVEAARSNQA